MRTIKSLLKTILLSGYMKLPDPFRARLMRNKITILLYHEIPADLFESHVHFFKEKYTIISLGRLKQVLYRETNETLPSNPLVITFDDGWKSNYQLLPIIKKHGVPVTIFITTGLVGSCRKIWNYTLDRNGKEKRLNSSLKTLGNSAKDKYLYEHNGFFPEKEYSGRDLMSVDEMKLMSKYVDFQSHGQFHPVFSNCEDEELQMEMVNSKKYIETTFGHSCYAISYPYGRHDKRVITFSQKSGYSIGRIANVPGLNTFNTDPYLLKSIGVYENASVRQLKECIAWAEVCSCIKS